MKDKIKTKMLPIGPLMIEHRLIERMVALLKKEATKIGTKNQVNCDFLREAIDFFKTYADRCHHGKEEDILFCALKNKPISSEHNNMLVGLLKDHAVARDLIHEKYIKLVEQIEKGES